MIEWFKQRSYLTRVSIYAAAAILAFAVAAGVGAIVALTIQGGAPQRQGADADRPDQENAAVQQGEAVEQTTTLLPQEDGGQQEDTAPRQDEAQYVVRVSELQARAVEAFSDSHDKISRYDALTADDIEAMQSNQATLQDITEQVSDLDPPQRYGEQHEAFRSAINEMYEAAQLAYDMAADPVSATQSEFEEYDRLVEGASSSLQRSSEILGRDYETLQDLQEVSPS